MSFMKKSRVGFILIEQPSQSVLTDSGKAVLFTDYGRFKEYAKKKRIPLLDYRVRLVKCRLFTKSYLVI